MTSFAPMRPVISIRTEHGQDIISLSCGHELVRFHRFKAPNRSRCEHCHAHLPLAQDAMTQAGMTTSRRMG